MRLVKQIKKVSQQNLIRLYFMLDLIWH